MKQADVTIGEPFFVVYNLGKQSFMIKFTPTEKPKQVQLTEHYSSWFVRGKKEWSKDLIVDDEISLRDCGIIPNDYNDHQTFISQKAAEKHLGIIKKLSRG